MAISKKQAVRELQTRANVYVVYAQATKLPYVTCDEETFNDQAWVFSTEEGLKEYGKKLMEKKIPILGMRYERKDLPKLYGILYAIGVNSVVWADKGEKIEVELSDIARQADMSKVEPAKRPLFNSTLQLSGIYFLQEARRPVKMEEKENIGELEEEFLVNLRKAEFLMAMEANKDDPKKMNIPYLKDKEGKILQPVFTDVMEFGKFAKDKKFRVAKLPFEKLKEIMIQQAAGVVINPMSFNLILTKDQVERIFG